MKNKICITTWYGVPNYGSNLQAIGLSRTLTKMGLDVYFLGKFKILSFMLRHPVLLYAKVLNKLRLKQRRQFFNPVPYEISAERESRLAEFKNDNFKVMNLIHKTDLEKDIAAGTIFAAGSDILWNPARGYPAENFLDFAYYAKLPRFSYASSIGALKLPKEYYRAYRRYLGSMKTVGVREQTSVAMLEPIIHREVTKVVDPTFLLSAKEWGEYADKASLSVKLSAKGFILCYFVMNDPRYWEYVKKMAEQTGKQIIVLPMHEQDEHQPYDIILDGTPYEFVWLVKNSDFVCTDSFHACVLSIIYQKDFYLLRRTRKAEDAKYDDLLGRYYLTDRVVTDESNFAPKPKTDYSYTNDELSKDIKDSLDFLKNSLEQCEKAI